MSFFLTPLVVFEYHLFNMFNNLSYNQLKPILKFEDPVKHSKHGIELLIEITIHDRWPYLVFFTPAPKKYYFYSQKMYFFDTQQFFYPHQFFYPSQFVYSLQKILDPPNFFTTYFFTSKVLFTFF